jgi:hypothetical protein
VFDIQKRFLNILNSIEYESICGCCYVLLLLRLGHLLLGVCIVVDSCCSLIDSRFRSVFHESIFDRGYDGTAVTEKGKGGT